MVTGKHILFIVENTSLPYDVRVWSEILALKAQGYQVSAICPTSERAAETIVQIEGIEIYRHPRPIEARKKMGFMFEYVNAFFWELLLSLFVFFKKPFQIIHAANPPDHIFIIALLFRLLGTRFIFDHHDITPENYLAKFGKKDFLYKLLIVMEKLTFIASDIVISTNESYRNIAITRGKKDPKDVFVVRNGPDLSKVVFMPPRAELREGFDYLVAYLGTIGSQEDIDVLLRIVKYIVFDKEVRNIKFIIIGTGPELKKMVSLAHELNVAEYVTFTGFIPYRKVYEILATADICVNPEYRNEFTDKSTMIKIMDYMTFGRPIVQFETKEGRITAGESSLYVTDNDPIPFAESILQLLKDQEKRSLMGQIGRNRIHSMLHWGKQQPNLLRAYEHLLDQTL
jgi:glycosyltransferase involved in cell wall biosynthesis